MLKIYWLCLFPSISYVDAKRNSQGRGWREGYRSESWLLSLCWEVFACFGLFVCLFCCVHFLRILLEAGKETWGLFMWLVLADYVGKSMLGALLFVTHAASLA